MEPLVLAAGLFVLLCITLLIIRRMKSLSNAAAAAATSNSTAATTASMKTIRSNKSLQDLANIDPSKAQVRLLYGTQTGTAERFSKLLAKELGKKYSSEGTHVDVVDIENYSGPDRLVTEKGRLVVFCMATYGDGEPTDNANEFYSWLCKEADAVEGGEKEPFLNGVTYAVFGLGNKQYEHFNAVGRKVFKSLGALGASPLIRRGDGDDDGLIDEEFEKWCAELMQALESKGPGSGGLVGPAGDGAGAQTLTPGQVPAYEIDLAPATGKGGVKAGPVFAPGSSGLDAQHPFMAKVSCVRELHGSSSDRSCVHVEIDLKGCKATYSHGDHVGILPQNSPAVTHEVSKLLGYPDPDAHVIVAVRRPAAGAAGGGPKGSAESLPSHPLSSSGPVTLSQALATFADVLATPHKENLLALAAFASDPDQAARLRKLCSAEGREEFSAYIAKPHRSLLEVMRDFPSAKPSLGAFFASVAPRLQPRFYSISSSPSVFPNSLHVTCSVVKDVTPSGRPHEGIASTFLQRLSPLVGSTAASVPIFIRHSHFKLPKNPMIPVVMVGPGTGLAPFRGFLQERSSMIKAGAKLGVSELFFGCRNKSHDYIYCEELEGFVREGALTNLHVAFSRDGQSKDYVQHHMERHQKDLWQLLSKEGAYLYVCGDAKHMAKDVHRTLISIVQGGKGCSGTQAEAFVKELQDGGRYQRDVW